MLRKKHNTKEVTPNFTKNIPEEKTSVKKTLLYVLIFFVIFMIANIFLYKKFYIGTSISDTRVPAAVLGVQKIVDAKGVLQREEDLLAYFPSETVNFPNIIDVPTKNYAYFNKYDLVTNNQNWLRYGLIARTKSTNPPIWIKISENGKSFIYAMYTKQKKLETVTNGIPHIYPYDQYLIADVCNNGNSQIIVGMYNNDPQTKYIEINGREVESVKAMTNFFYGNNCQKYAYVVSVDQNKQYVVFGKSKQNTFKNIYFVTISPDGNHIAYAVEKNNMMYLVKDGVEQKTSYAKITSIVFSPDSKHIAYTFAKKQGDVMYGGVAIDSKEYNNYDSVTTPVFSLNSKHIAFVTQDVSKNKVYILEDFKKIAQFQYASSLVGFLQFAPDNKTVIGGQIKFITQEDFIESVIFDNKVGYGWNTQMHEGILSQFNFSSDNKYIEYAAESGKKLLWVKERIQQ